MLGHLLRTRRAIEPDQWHIQRVHHRGRRSDIRAHQQRAGRLDRHLHENRRVRPCLGPGELGAVHSRLDLQRVLARLDQDRIDPASDEPAGLRRQRRLERIIGDVPQ